MLTVSANSLHQKDGDAIDVNAISPLGPCTEVTITSYQAH
eukprot:gene4950-2373_t